DQAMQFLAGLDLPGNVRQLENLCNWITVMAPGQTVEIKDLPAELIEAHATGQAAASAAVASGTANGMQQERAASEVGNHAAAADMIGLAPRTPAGAPDQGSAAPDDRRGSGIKNAGTNVSWIALLEAEAASMLSAGRPEVMDELGRQFESALIKTALRYTHGRKNDAAIRLGIGRNTITRKIQDLGIDGARDE